MKEKEKPDSILSKNYLLPITKGREKRIEMGIDRLFLCIQITLNIKIWKFPGNVTHLKKYNSS